MPERRRAPGGAVGVSANFFVTTHPPKKFEKWVTTLEKGWIGREVR